MTTRRNRYTIARVENPERLRMTSSNCLSDQVRYPSILAPVADENGWFHSVATNLLAAGTLNFPGGNFGAVRPRNAPTARNEPKSERDIVFNLFWRRHWWFAEHLVNCRRHTERAGDLVILRASLS